MLKKLILSIGFSIFFIGMAVLLFIESSEKTQVDSTSNLSKDIQESYEIGNFFNNGLKSGMTFTKLEQGNHKASIRFTNSITGNVNNITLSVSSNNQQQVIVGLQEDDGNGNPLGKWLGDVAFNKTSVSKKLDQTFTFQENALIEEDKIYHIVIESENANKTNNVKIKNYQVNTPHQPYNPLNPDIYLSDSSLNSLFFDGTNWIEEDKWPTFLVSFEDGKKIGQPYTLAAGWVIRDLTWVGQTFIPSSDYTVSKLGFVVSKQGEPAQPLFYGIQDSKNNILSTGFFTDANQLSWGQNWIEILLDKPVFFESGELYRIYLYSPIPREDEFYRVFGHEYSFDYYIGYGELRHHLTISHDKGNIWSKWDDADLIFKLTT